MRLYVAILFAATAVLDAEQPKAEAFCEEAEKRIEEKPSVQGDNESWFFLTKELRHVATGKFWEKPWEEIAANSTDPVPSIVEFHNMLSDRGIDLLLVPIPAKASIYPEKLSGEFEPGDAFSMKPFVNRIREMGVPVLDLESRFLAFRKGDERKLYCEQDAHFSPEAAQLVAEWIADEMGWEKQESSKMSVSMKKELTIVGDQVIGSEWEGKIPSETLSMQQVLTNNVPGVVPNDSSSALLLGDSHTLVFHQGSGSGMHTEGAGVFDHLSHRVGFPLALVGVRGSGLVQARKQLFYTAASVEDFWKSKSSVIWMFSVREFTQSTDRLISIPLDRE